MGSATVPGVAAGEDVGMVMSAVNANTGLTGLARFHGFAVGSYVPAAPTTGAAR